MSETIPEPVAGAQRTVLTPGGRLHVTDYPGASPPLVMLHGFPDDSRIYDRLAPLLPPRRAVALDWLGYGRSDRAEPGSSHGVHHQQELRALLDSLDLDQVALVGHDASGPDAIEFALNEPGRIGHLALLNTYYGHAPALRLPEMIRLLAAPGLTPLADAMMGELGKRRKARVGEQPDHLRQTQRRRVAVVGVKEDKMADSSGLIQREFDGVRA